ncbi:hypothetical protein VKS41_008809 [Umbelopsis sp. WA50703]
MSGKGQYNVIVEMDDEPTIQADSIDNDVLQFQDFSSSSAGNNSGRLNSSKQPFAAAAAGGGNFFDPHQQIQDQAMGRRPMWSLDYYSQFFDVDTSQVLERCFRSLYPVGLFEEVLNDNPDLYGPFWVTTTVIFTTFVTSSLAASIVAYMSGTEYVYQFGTLSFAVFVIYSYTFGSAFLCWAATKYYGCQPSLLNIINLYGYSMTAWIPVSILCVMPYDIVRWVLVAAVFVLTGVFLIKNLYAIISRADAKTSRLLLIGILAGHAIFAVTLKLAFYSNDFRDASQDTPSV